MILAVFLFMRSVEDLTALNDKKAKQISVPSLFCRLVVPSPRIMTAGIVKTKTKAVLPSHRQKLRRENDELRQQSCNEERETNKQYVYGEIVLMQHDWMQEGARRLNFKPANLS